MRPLDFPEKEYCIVHGQVEARTAKAVLIEVYGRDEAVWVPRSVIKELDDEPGVQTEFEIEDWFVDKECL